MTVDQGHAQPVGQVEAAAVPEQVLCVDPTQGEVHVGLGERRPSHARVHEQVVPVPVPGDELAVELLVGRRQHELLAAAGLALEEAVAGQGAVAAVDQEGVASEVEIGAPAEEVEEHGLVVPQQEHAGPVRRQAQQALDHAAGVGPAVHVVPQEDEAVAGGERQDGEQLVEQLGFAVDVPHRVEHGSPFRPFRRIAVGGSARPRMVPASAAGARSERNASEASAAGARSEA